MPRRNDIQKILVIGSGPIVIGQSAEFDYSGTQACKALKQEGYEVVLVNSNPATIMTDPELADRTYIEPLTREYVEEIIRLESVMLANDPRSGKFALLPTGGYDLFDEPAQFETATTGRWVENAAPRDGASWVAGVKLVGEHRVPLPITLPLSVKTDQNRVTAVNFGFGYPHRRTTAVCAQIV